MYRLALPTAFALRGALAFLTRLPVRHDERSWRQFRERPVALVLAGYLVGGLVAAATIARHAGVDVPLALATTSFVAEDRSVDLRRAADQLDLDLVVTDPGFDRSDHPALVPYARGEAKEGVGMGGALHLAGREGIPMRDVRGRCIERYETAVGHTDR